MKHHFNKNIKPNNIINNIHGIFVWVFLVKDELENCGWENCGWENCGWENRGSHESKKTGVIAIQ